MPGAATGSLFLLCLVASASLMPVQSLPPPSWQSALALGFVSAFFDNIPLTALALKQGGYDWGVLAYAVGFGGSMIWFGSSAGVAICNMFPEARSTRRWLREGWLVAVGYVGGLRRAARDARLEPGALGSPVAHRPRDAARNSRASVSARRMCRHGRSRRCPASFASSRAVPSAPSP